MINDIVNVCTRACMCVCVCMCMSVDEMVEENRRTEIVAREKIKRDLE